MSSKEEAPSVHFLVDAARKHEMWIIGGSIPEIVPASSSDKDSTIFNTCLCISPSGEIVAKHRKVHLFDIDVPGKITFRESDTLSGGSTISTFDAPFGKIGVGICYDIRFPEQAQCMIERGCKILVYPGAFNLTTGPAHWELLQRARAVDGQCFVLTASPARSDPPAEDSKTSYPHYSAWGHSTAVSPWGEVIATCDEKENMVLADLDMSLADEMRKSIPTTLQKRSDLYVMSDLTRK
jgi:omega-amidase